MSWLERMGLFVVGVLMLVVGIGLLFMAYYDGKASVTMLFILPCAVAGGATALVGAILLNLALIGQWPDNWLQ